MMKRFVQALLLTGSTALLAGCLSINVDKKEVEKDSALHSPESTTAAAR